MATAQAGGNNASEFVRKLYRMLEDPTHQDVARWGKDGDTFVVVEGEKFTRHILPKHFKHSNMSSFIRQLNKYDFHKVKPSSDNDSSTPMGNVLEFKHPYFRIDSKDDLDNIRRKAPAPRKTQAAEEFTTNQHISVLSEQLHATQQQVQQLQELYTEIASTNKVLVQEVWGLQKILNNQKQAQHEMLNYLTPYNDGRNGTGAGSGNGTFMQSMNSASSNDGEEAIPELRRARELLSSVTTDSTADRELERLHGVYGSPTESTALVTPSAQVMHDPMNDIGRYPVYPVGQTVGIDPFHSDHIHKIPYSLPGDGVATAAIADPPQLQTLRNSTASLGSADSHSNQWGPKKPRIFLIEDDPTCSKIGIKFLKSMGCDVEHAANGVDAYNRITTLSRDYFDMIFMDIIMPRLDGVSTTLYIRQTLPNIPVVAMTSNIRPEEVQGYFEHGMNGVLAKPFTKEGMSKCIRTQLAHLLKNPPANDQGTNTSGYFPYLNTSGNLATATTPIKFDTPTPPSGIQGATWSPAQMPQPSPIEQSYNMMNGATQFGLSTGNRYMASGDSGRVSDLDSPPEKRQRLNAPGTF